jgi:hypothetical protein
MKTILRKLGLEEFKIEPRPQLGEIHFSHPPEPVEWKPSSTIHTSSSSLISLQPYRHSGEDARVGTRSRLSRAKPGTEGFPDMVVIRRRKSVNFPVPPDNSRPGSYHKNVHVCVEVKKPAAAGETKAYHQATAQLLVLDQLACGPAMSITTDLADSWTFFWLGLCPSSNAARRWMFSMEVAGLKLDISTLKRVLNCNSNLPCAEEFCPACGSTYKKHLTKYRNMEAASALAEAGHLDAAPPGTDADVNVLLLDARYGQTPSALECQATWRFHASSLHHKSALDIRAE